MVFLLLDGRKEEVRGKEWNQYIRRQLASQASTAFKGGVPIWRRKRKVLKILLLIVIILAVLMFAAFYRGLVIRRYEVASAKYPDGEAVKAVLLADLHSYIYKPDQEPIIRIWQPAGTPTADRYGFPFCSTACSRPNRDGIPNARVGAIRRRGQALW